MSYLLEGYLLDAVELVMREEFADTLDDSALSSAVVSMASYLAHQAQD
ncbi:MAG: hypothetical protein NTY05_14310 [Rhodocyclales bacterium]|nr:hypothetical protein [Rhodocyclales bacterium]